MLGIDLTGKRALVAGVSDDGGFGFATFVASTTPLQILSCACASGAATARRKSRRVIRTIIGYWIMLPAGM